MSDNFETAIKNFSGLSTETKPTTAAGNNVPNGSRWREVDTNQVYFFNKADDTWYTSGVAPPDFALQVARGFVPGIVGMNKFGNAPNGVQTTITDIWSLANATPTQQIWVAPLAARIHTIKSTSTDDDGAPVGDGARTLRIWGLKTWDTPESSEDVILNGTTNVNTGNAYVIIHRMRVLTAGTTSINVGTISATAVSDGSITAVITAGEGQTNMAIYGVSSLQTFYLTTLSASMNNSSAKSRIDLELRVNTSPDISALNVRFISKNHLQLQNEGSSFMERKFNPYRKFSGPCIIKVQAVGSEADMDCFAGFDGFLVTN